MEKLKRYYARGRIRLPVIEDEVKPMSFIKLFDDFEKAKRYLVRTFNKIVKERNYKLKDISYTLKIFEADIDELGDWVEALKWSETAKKSKGFRTSVYSIEWCLNHKGELIRLSLNLDQDIHSGVTGYR